MSTRADLTGALIALERLSRELTETLHDALGVTGNVEAQILLLVHEHPGITPGGIAAATGLRKSAVSRVVATLLDLGWVTRRPGRSDARSATLRVSVKGARKIAGLEGAVIRLFAHRFAELRWSRRVLSGARPVDQGTVTGLAAMRSLASVGELYGRDVAQVLIAYGVADAASRATITLLAEAETLRPTALGRELGLSSSGTSDLLDRLGAAGLIDRRHDEDADRRAVQVRLTERGIEAAEAKLDVFARHARPIAAALDVTLQCTAASNADTA